MSVEICNWVFNYFNVNSDKKKDMVFFCHCWKPHPFLFCSYPPTSSSSLLNNNLFPGFIISIQQTFIVPEVFFSSGTLQNRTIHCYNSPLWKSAGPGTRNLLGNLVGLIQTLGGSSLNSEDKWKVIRDWRSVYHGIRAWYNLLCS